MPVFTLINKTNNQEYTGFHEESWQSYYGFLVCDSHPDKPGILGEIGRLGINCFTLKEGDLVRFNGNFKPPPPRPAPPFPHPPPRPPLPISPAEAIEAEWEDKIKHEALSLIGEVLETKEKPPGKRKRKNDKRTR